jgi:hypothetical protein
MAKNEQFPFLREMASIRNRRSAARGGCVARLSSKNQARSARRVPVRCENGTFERQFLGQAQFLVAGTPASMLMAFSGAMKKTSEGAAEAARNWRF